MPLKCFEKPNRTKLRPFGARDAARIMCRVTRAGGSKAEIEAHYKKICTKAPSRKSQAQEALQAAESALVDNNISLDLAFRDFQVINGLVQGLGLALTFVPGIARFFRIGPQALNLLITARMGTLTRQQAANADTMAIIRQAAANEERFRIASGG